MGNEFDKNKDQQQQDPQQKRDQGQGQGQSQDIGNKKSPNQDIQDRNREGSEEVEKRRAS